MSEENAVRDEDESEAHPSVRAILGQLAEAFPFPDPRESDERGLLAYGGDLAAERLLSAYAQGIFPWYSEEPILWFSPDPRMVLVPSELSIGRSLAKRQRTGPYRLTMDQAFRRVIVGCREAERPDQDGTWITEAMVEAYCELHALGFAHSVEAWERGETGEGEERLVGGLYGVSLGRAFFGESMFAAAPDASKLAFAAFATQLGTWGFDFIDCQVHTDHLARFGATQWPRETFLDGLERALEGETRRGAWSFDELPGPTDPG